MKSNSNDRLSGWTVSDACREAAERIRANGVTVHPDRLSGWRLDDACSEAAERARANRR